MLGHLLDGGLIMFPLLILSILGIAIIIDRMRTFKMAVVDKQALHNAIIGSLEDGDINTAIHKCEDFRGPVSAVLMVGLLKLRKLVQIGKPVSEIEVNVDKAMSDYAPRMIETLEKRLNILNMIATISPLLGMTGTVTGMIASFQGLASAGALDAGAVSSGIAEALVTTAAGLIIAIPSVVAYNVFSKKIDSFILDIEEASTNLHEQISLNCGVSE